MTQPRRRNRVAGPVMDSFRMAAWLMISSSYSIIACEGDNAIATTNLNPAGPGGNG
jgi:hypothetical protein